MGKGLRNKLAESFAENNKDLAKVYVSTTYAILFIIITLVLVLFFIVNPFLNWFEILNVNFELNSELSTIALIVFTLFCFRFIAKLINTILASDQRTANAELIEFFGKLLSLLIIYLFTLTTEGSLLFLALGISISPVLVLIISSIILFNRRYKFCRPSLKYIDFKYSKVLLNLGVKFFIIQIAALLLYQTNNIIIAQLFGPSEVTPYNIAFKYFSLITLGFSIIVSPYWSAYTEAYILKDFTWIKRTIKQIIIIWCVFVIIGLVLLFSSGLFYKIWVGDKVVIPFFMSLIVLLYSLINAWNSIFSTFLNGVGKLKLQLIVGISAAILNVPLAISLGKIFGIIGVLSSNVILGAIAMFIYPIQFKKILNQSKLSIWN